MGNLCTVPELIVLIQAIVGYFYTSRPTRNAIDIDSKTRGKFDAYTECLNPRKNGASISYVQLYVNIQSQ